MIENDTFNLTEEQQRENIIKLIDKDKFKKNLSYQVVMNKFALTPYIYELDDIDDIFEDYRNIAKSSINNYVLHPFQLEILTKLKNGENIIVSAPTSFGKTASIFEYIHQENKNLKKILIIVPTIALRNEYLEKINDCLNGHKIITNSKDIEKYEKFCLILTHERFIEYFSKNNAENFKIDLLVIDEIYKLQNESNSERMYSMSLAYLTAIKISNQFVFLGPFINSITLPDISNFKVLKYDYSPIALDMNYETEYSIDLLKKRINAHEKTLVYFSNKKEIISTIEEFVSDKENNKNKELLDYIKREYDEKWLTEWTIMKALKNGIGVHYNELPSFIKEYVIDSYNNTDETMLLFSTSTLLEGVNTSTKNLIITSDKIGNSKLSDFEFWNLAGRAGRLGKYKVGNVIYFGDKEDFKKERRYIDLNNLWINDETNKDEYELINNGNLTNEEKQSKLDRIMLNYKLTIDEIKFILLPFFSKIDNMLEFFENVFPELLEEIKKLLDESLNSEKINSRNVRKLIFNKFIKSYKPPINIGALPCDQFSILSDAINMMYTNKTNKIKNIVENGRKILSKYPDEPIEIKIDKMNNLYNYSFYMVNNYVENSYIPGINILKMILDKNNNLDRKQNELLNGYVFRQVEKYSAMISDDEIFETLGVIPPLISIIRENVDQKQINNISELKEQIINNLEKIKSNIADNKLCSHYFEILIKKLKI